MSRKRRVKVRVRLRNPEVLPGAIEKLKESFPDEPDVVVDMDLTEYQHNCADVHLETDINRKGSERLEELAEAYERAEKENAPRDGQARKQKQLKRERHHRLVRSILGLRKAGVWVVGKVVKIMVGAGESEDK